MALPCRRLGEAYLTHSGTEYMVHPAEGGHADYSPRNDLEMGLSIYMHELAARGQVGRCGCAVLRGRDGGWAVAQWGRFRSAQGTGASETPEVIPTGAWELVC